MVLKTKKHFLYFVDLNIYFLFRKMFYQRMVGYRLGTVNYLSCEFKPFFRYSKPHTYSTLCFGEEKKEQCA